MRISDWSSDVCSSDLGAVHALAQGPGNTGARTRRHGAPGRGRSVSEEQRLYGINAVRAAFARRPQALRKIGRASSRERGCQEVELSVVAVSLNKTTHQARTRKR